MVKRLLIAYFIGNICAKKISKSIHVRQSYSKPKVGRFLRHGVDIENVANTDLLTDCMYLPQKKHTIY